MPNVRHVVDHIDWIKYGVRQRKLHHWCEYRHRKSNGKCDGGWRLREAQSRRGDPTGRAIEPSIRPVGPSRSGLAITCGDEISRVGAACLRRPRSSKNAS